MRRLIPLLALVLVAAIALAAGCGGGSDEVSLAEAKAAYLPIREDLIGVGRDLGIAISGADQRSDAQLRVSFGQLADRTASVGERVGALEVPADLADQRDALQQAVAVAAADLGRISDAAGAHDGPAARTATEQLVDHSATVRSTRTALDTPFGIREEDEQGSATAPESTTAPTPTATAPGE